MCAWSCGEEEVRVSPEGEGQAEESHQDTDSISHALPGMLSHLIPFTTSNLNFAMYWTGLVWEVGITRLREQLVGEGKDNEEERRETCRGHDRTGKSYDRRMDAMISYGPSFGL